MVATANRAASAQVWALVPAAGLGRRMGNDTPKQYLTIAGRPILYHTLERLADLPEISGIVLVLAAGESGIEAGLLNQLSVPVHCVTGGAERSDSVLAGLDWLATQPGGHSDPWVLVHDAARPGVRAQDVSALLAHCRQLVVAEATSAGGAILAVPARDTVKRTQGSAGCQNAGQRITDTLPREQIWLAQTPQCFPLSVLRQALTTARESGTPITDEAAAMQLAGHAVDVIPGHWQNTKLTVPEDLPLLEWILTRDE